MAMLAAKFEEHTMDQRIARVEAHVEHIQSDVSELKLDLRRVDDKLDALALSTEKGFASLTRWGIGLYITLVAGMATGFMWIIQRLPLIQP